MYYGFFKWQVIGNAVIKHQCPYQYVLVLQMPYFHPKCLAMDRYFNIDFDSNGLLFLFHIFESSAFNLSKNKSISIEKSRALVRKVFGSPYTINQIYLLQNWFSNYVYFKDMYITLKEIRKLLFLMVLRILLICKFLNLTAIFTIQKKLNVWVKTCQITKAITRHHLRFFFKTCLNKDINRSNPWQKVLHPIICCSGVIAFLI